uniref:Secreted protein n=1 Tax=Haemonchus contortus TaxID=6289 RepID=A0A7I4Y8H8_HAECO|nr:Protein T05C1.1 [Haemonchus contortus]
MQFLLLLLVALGIPINAKKLTCVVCQFSSKGNSQCHGECEGDICTLAKNTRDNGIIVADCMNRGPIPEGPAVCHESFGEIICACSTKDRCNDPTSSLDGFKKLDKEFTHEGVIVPQRGGGGGGGKAAGSAGESEGAHSSELKRQVETEQIETASDTVAKAGATDTEASGASEAGAETNSDEGAEVGATDQATTTTTAKKGFDIKNIFGKSAFDSMPLTMTVVFSTTIIACVLHF